MEELKTGEYYNVTCTEIRMNDGRNYYIPVFDHLHADAQFGFPHQHYHIDGRFYLDPRMRHQFHLEDGHTSSVILPTGAKGYRFIALVLQNLQCVRLDTGLTIPINSAEIAASKLALYRNWYQTYVGKICEGRKCPHFGTYMLEKSGMLVCPMHNLIADAATLKVLPLNAITLPDELSAGIPVAGHLL